MPFQYGGGGGGGGGGGSSAIIGSAVDTTALSFTTSSNVFVAFDNAHATVAFTVPASGKVLIVLNGYGNGTSGGAILKWAVGVHNGPGSPNQAAVAPVGLTSDNDGSRMTSFHYLTGLTPGAAVQYDWMHASGLNGTNVNTSGDDGTGVNAKGPLIMTVYAL